MIKKKKSSQILSLFMAILVLLGILDVTTLKVSAAEEEQVPTISYITKSTSTKAEPYIKALPGDDLYLYGTNFVTKVSKVVFTDAKGKAVEIEPIKVYLGKRIHIKLPMTLEAGIGSLRVENKLENRTIKSEEYTFTIRDAHAEYLESIQAPTISYITNSASTKAEPLTKALPGDDLYINGTNFDNTLSKVIYTDVNGKAEEIEAITISYGKKIHIKLPSTLAKGTGSIRVENRVESVNKKSEEFTFTIVE